MLFRARGSIEVKLKCVDSEVNEREGRRLACCFKHLLELVFGYALCTVAGEGNDVPERGGEHFDGRVWVGFVELSSSLP